MAAKIDLRKVFNEQHPHPANTGDLYVCNNEFGLWFESSIGDEFKMAAFVWMQEGKCVMSFVKLAKKAVGRLSFGTKPVVSPTKSAEVCLHSVNLFPKVSIAFSIQIGSFDICYLPLIYEYVSDPDTTFNDEDSEDEPESVESHDSVECNDGDDAYCDVPQFENRDQKALHQYVTNFWCFNSAFVSPDRKMAILTKKLVNGLILVKSENGKIATYDYVSHEDCSEVDAKGNKNPDVFPWICDEDVMRFSRPVFEENAATVYCKRFYGNSNLGTYNTKFTLARLPEF